MGVINKGTDAPLKSKRGALGGQLFCSDLKSLRDVEKARRLNADTVEGCRVTFPPQIRKQSVQCWFSTQLLLRLDTVDMASVYFYYSKGDVRAEGQQEAQSEALLSFIVTTLIKLKTQTFICARIGSLQSPGSH